METYPLTIRPRCDTENEWIKYNPVLKYKEFVVSVDKNGARYKIGDGISKYDSALKDLCEDFCGFYITDIFDIVINLLEEVFHDQEEWIGYFVFEEDWLHGFKIGDVIVNNVPVIIDNWGDVYDFLIVNMEEENEKTI